MTIANQENPDPYYAGKWYYFGKCTPRPIQVSGWPNPPYKVFNTKEECQAYIDGLKK